MPHPALKEAEPAHISALDGLRGLAILLVLIRHLDFTAGRNGGWWEHGLAVIAGFGFIGVDLFFVLSGFLITGILYRTLGGNAYFKNFYMRRFLRIFPLYYGYIFLLVVLSHPFHIVWNGMLPVFLGYTQNIFLVKPYTVLWYYTGQLWSLAVEEQFYIVWPLLIFLIRDRKRVMRTTIMLSIAAFALRVALYANGVSGDLIYTLTPCRMDSLLIGSWLALAMRGPARALILKFARLVFAVCGALYVFLVILSGFSSIPLGYVFSTIGYSIVAIGFASLLSMALVPRSFTSRLCQTRVLRWFGRYSYGIYVLHLAAAHLAHGAISRGLYFKAALVQVHSFQYVAYLLSILVTLGLAWLSYNFYEVHFLRLKRHFSYSSQSVRRPFAPE